MNNKTDLNEINSTDDLVGLYAFDKFDDVVKIANIFRDPGKLTTATIIKINNNNNFHPIDVPSCCIEAIPKENKQIDKCIACNNLRKCKFKKDYVSGIGGCPKTD